MPKMWTITGENGDGHRPTLMLGGQFWKFSQWGKNHFYGGGQNFFGHSFPFGEILANLLVSNYSRHRLISPRIIRSTA